IGALTAAMSASTASWSTKRNGSASNTTRGETHMTEISEKEVEAALSAWNNYSNSGPVAEDRSDAMRVALEAAACVRAEANNECGEAAHPAPQPSVKVKPLEWVASDDWEYRWT